MQEEWWGWRPMVPDGKALIGRLPKFDNAWLAAGHGMLGVSMATGTGKPRQRNDDGPDAAHRPEAVPRRAVLMSFRAQRGIF